MRTLPRLLAVALAVALAAGVLLWMLHTYRSCPEREDFGLEFLMSKAEQDASERYSKHLFVMTGRDWETLSSRPLCLATQASLEHLHWLVNVTGAWRGPVSVAVFTPDVEFQLGVLYLQHLRACFPAIASQVSFHFVYPVDRPPRLAPGGGGVDCSRHYRHYLEELLSRRPPAMLKGWRERLEYPQNLMRNTAKSSCPGRFILCPDVDMFLTSPDVEQQLSSFLQRQKCPKCAYVLPVYEIDASQPSPPANKSVLLQMVRKRQARAFHIAVFKDNQGLSKLGAWERLPKGSELKASYTVKNYNFWYEPMFVATRDAPRFDERFVGFGNTRNTQVYEMFLAGWTFKVLNEAFLVHWGFQTIKQRPSWRQKQATVNLGRLKTFVREMAVKYDKDPLHMLTRFPHRSANFQLEEKTRVTASHQNVTSE